MKEADSKNKGADMSRISPSSPTPNRSPQPDPLPPKAPESVLNWTELTPGEQITISHTGIVEHAGEVDTVAEDGSILWVHLEAGGGRIMIHKSDKQEIRRLPTEAHATGIYGATIMAPISTQYTPAAPR